MRSPAPAPAPSGPSSAAAGPIGAAEAFYHLASSHDYAAAWSLADPSFRAQLGGYDAFASQQAADEAVRFDSVRLVSYSGSAATIAIGTTSTHPDGVQHCGGTVDLLRYGSGGSWLLHQIHITCG